MGRWGQRQLRGRKQASLWELKLLVYRDFRQNGGGSVTELRGAVTTSPSEAVTRTSDSERAPGGLCPLYVP